MRPSNIHTLNSKSHVPFFRHRILARMWLMDQVQFLLRSQAKPSPSKRKFRSVNLRQSQHVTIERNALIDITNMDC